MQWALDYDVTLRSLDVSSMALHWAGHSGYETVALHWTVYSTYLELAAFILTQLRDLGSIVDHNRLSDVVACKGTFELTL